MSLYMNIDIRPLIKIVITFGLSLIIITKK